MILALDAIRTDGNTQSRAGLYESTVRDYALDMLGGDRFPPLDVFHDGSEYWLAGGFHRVAAAASIGETEFPVIVHQGGPREAYLFAVEDNRKNGERYTNADKRAMVLRFLNDPEWSKWSDREIARRCGVSHPFVGELRAIWKPLPDSPERLVERNGAVYAMETAAINAGRTRVCPYCATTYASDSDGTTECPNCGNLHMYSGPRDTDRYGPYPTLERTQPTTLEIMHSSASVEWYTPSAYLESARAVLGEIDLDPASNPHANQVVKAERYFTRDDDGLSQPWAGRVWLNPPYGKAENNQSNQARWSERLVDAYTAGTIEAAVLLVSANTGDKWFQKLWSFPMCFTDHRIDFYGPTDQQMSGPNHGSVLVYFGTDPDLFAVCFRQHGRIVVPRGDRSEVIV